MTTAIGAGQASVVAPAHTGSPKGGAAAKAHAKFAHDVAEKAEDSPRPTGRRDEADVHIGGQKCGEAVSTAPRRQREKRRSRQLIRGDDRRHRPPGSAECCHRRRADGRLECNARVWPSDFGSIAEIEQREIRRRAGFEHRQCAGLGESTETRKYNGAAAGQAAVARQRRGGKCRCCSTDRRGGHVRDHRPVS